MHAHRHPPRAHLPPPPVKVITFLLRPPGNGIGDVLQASRSIYALLARVRHFPPRPRNSSNSFFAAGVHRNENQVCKLIRRFQIYRVFFSSIREKRKKRNLDSNNGIIEHWINYRFYMFLTLTRNLFFKIEIQECDIWFLRGIIIWVSIFLNLLYASMTKYFIYWYFFKRKILGKRNTKSRIFVQLRIAVCIFFI